MILENAKHGVKLVVDSETRPFAFGIAPDGDGKSKVWVRYDRVDAEAEVGWEPSDGNTEFAERLTGWKFYNPSEPGGSYALDPEIVVGKYSIFISQVRGRDV